MGKYIRITLGGKYNGSGEEDWGLGGGGFSSDEIAFAIIIPELERGNGLGDLSGNIEGGGYIKLLTGL